MKKGYLSQYFKGIAVKTLSSVEADTLKSNQHEFNGVKELRSILGESAGKIEYSAQFLYLTDYETDPILEEGFLTWYDAREKARTERGVMRYEYRLYFPTNQVIQIANTGDILIIAKKQDDTLLAIIAEKDTTIANQIIWLFGITDIDHPGFSIREELETNQDRIEFASRLILENIGISIETTEETYLDKMICNYGLKFPTTREFSEYSRSTLQDIDSFKDPDYVLISYMEREEILFKTLEKHIIGERLSKGFDGDVDSFISFSLSVQNRRKSRAGLAFENHLEYIFQKLNINFSRTAITENKSKPDFIFPGKIEYHDCNFNSLYLTMLGVKSTCKDRWRQVLAEADRIDKKHLLTLEAAISTNQTNEMNAKRLQLVVPRQLHKSYTKAQQEWLMDFKSFTQFVKEKQKIAGI
ncbi:MAG: restriction endonuclease [Spirochaetes bacterium]|nr:restriction endonuclease [Spirochaetota bacterium]